MKIRREESAGVSALTVTLSVREGSELYRALRFARWDSTPDANQGQALESALYGALTEEERDS